MKELEDYDWFPKLLRQYQTDYIGFVVARFNTYNPFIQYLKSKNDLPPIMFDLCSGSGEPAIVVFKRSGAFRRLILSDKFPSDRPFDNNISYIHFSTDVLNHSYEPTQTYTMFNAFHHFSDPEKKQIVTGLSNREAKGFFVEILAPDFLHFIKILFATTIGTLILTPFVKPFSFKRLFFTYLVPVNLLTIFYDGMVSVMKARSVAQYKALLKPFGDKVEVFKIKNVLSPLIVIQVK